MAEVALLRTGARQLTEGIRVSYDRCRIVDVLMEIFPGVQRKS